MNWLDVETKAILHMKHWAGRIEAEVRCDGVPDIPPDEEIHMPLKSPEAD